MVNEDNLLLRIEKGDSTGLDELVTAYYSDILRYCYWHTSDKQTAEDATQDTFLKAFRHLDTYIHKGKFRAYLYKIASNICIDYHRKKQTDELPDNLPERESQFEKVETEMYFSDAIRRLPVELQEIVLLRFVHDLKIKEIAQILNLPLRTVQSRLRSSLKKIKSEMTEGK